MYGKSLLSKITGIKKPKEEEQQEEEEKIDAALDEIEALKMNEKGLTKKPHPQPTTQDDSNNWAQENYEGQLSVDVYQTKNEIVIKSAVAGVEARDLDISISNDMITIRGTRQQEEKVPAEDYFYQECYWGPFSRSIILPQEVKAETAKADFKKGILTIRLPKAQHAQKIQIQVSPEE